jgi:hypothetical protein
MSKSRYNWRSASQFVLMSSPILWFRTRFESLSRELQFCHCMASSLMTRRVRQS